ncbi:MAG TPA: hypothetical protein DCR14_16980 [Acidimicrobiaceae bacterium]|nr:hypothetical protein [Acidimicrobiaceae bacterium]
MPKRRVQSAVIAAVAAAAALGACNDDPATVAPTTSSLPATTTTRPDDGVFLIGLVVPSVGSGVEIGRSVDDAVALAVQQINDAGGVNGQQVQVVRREEGDTVAASQVAVQSLVQLGADVIVGPTSSLTLLGALPLAVDAGILTCSPTATALALDDFPDNGLFVRTSPSDSLQATALAQLVEESGSGTAAVVYLDDPYGRPFAAAVERALRRNGTTVAESVPFTATGASLRAAADRVAAADPDVVVVVADGGSGPLVIDAIDAISDGRGPSFVVNDAVRRPAATAEPFDRLLAARIEGVSPLAHTTSTTFLDALTALSPSATGLYAHQAYDCVTVMALGAMAADSNRPAAIAAAIPAVTNGGTACASFPACVTSLEAGRNIDYDGPAGVLAIGPSGDPTAAVFEHFGFDSSGRDEARGVVIVGDD